MSTCSDAYLDCVFLVVLTHIWWSYQLDCLFQIHCIEPFLVVLLAHLAQRAMWAFVITLRPSSSSSASVNFSYVHLLLWNHWTDLDQTWQKCSLGGLPSDLLFWCRSEIQLWKSSCHKIPSRWNCNIIEMMSMWSSTLYQVCYFCADRISKMAAMTWLSLTLDPMGISHFHLFFWNHKTDLNQTWLDIIYYMLWYNVCHLYCIFITWVSVPVKL
jgi:hypothetical protein